jgi:hypothetical protein
MTIKIGIENCATGCNGPFSEKFPEAIYTDLHRFYRFGEGVEVWGWGCWDRGTVLFDHGNEFVAEDVTI